MDQDDSVTEFGKLSRDAIPVALLLAEACAVEGMQARIFAAIRSLLRGETPDLAGLAPEVTAAVPRLKELDRRSLEMVGGCFGLVGDDGQLVNEPTLVVYVIFMSGRKKNVITKEEIKQLIATFKDPMASVPTGLSPCAAEAAQIMWFLPEKSISDIESLLFGYDPMVGSEDND